jgi:hypothetical protein
MLNLKTNRRVALPRILMTLLMFCSVSAQAIAQPAANEPPRRWWKGNLHTHSLWSDGDDFPDMIAAWYVEHDYNFLALSDHNVLSQGVRWMPLTKIIARSDEGILDRYRAKFGDNWVETRGVAGQEEFAVRLKPLDEFRCLFEQAGKFIMIQGEEISDFAEGKPVHMNATNVSELLEPVGGATVRETMQNNLRLVLEHEKATGRQILPHLNHPNFGYAITAEDIAQVIEERFFEVYNGHPGVNQLGDAEHISIEEMWDVANALRLTVLDADPVFGIATDDSHEYHGRPGSRPGRGWVMVRARYLTPEHLIRAMKAGDFYASSGVVLEDVQYDAQARQLSIAIAPHPTATFETKFVAVLKPDPSDADNTEVQLNSVVVATVTGLTPSYHLRGNELYVRAVVNSSLAHVDPSLEGQKQQAWTQPVGWRD